MSNRENINFETYFPTDKFANSKNFIQNKFKLSIKSIVKDIKAKNNMFNGLGELEGHIETFVLNKVYI